MNSIGAEFKHSNNMDVIVVDDDNVCNHSAVLIIDDPRQLNARYIDIPTLDADIKTFKSMIYQTVTFYNKCIRGPIDAIDCDTFDLTEDETYLVETLDEAGRITNKLYEDMNCDECVRSMYRGLQLRAHRQLKKRKVLVELQPSSPIYIKDDIDDLRDIKDAQSPIF